MFRLDVSISKLDFFHTRNCLASSIRRFATGRAHLDTTTGPRLYPKDQPQHAESAKSLKWSQYLGSREGAAAGAPHSRAPWDANGRLALERLTGVYTPSWQ